MNLSTKSTLLASLLFAFAAAPPRVEDPEALHREARASLEAGDAEAALAQAERALEWRPDDAELLALAARACVVGEDPDRAYWYARLALANAAGDRDLRDVADEVEELVATLPLPEVSTGELVDDFIEERLKLARKCRRSKLYANAVDLLSACRGTRFEEDADEQLEKLYDNERVVEALLASGIDVPAQPITDRSPEWIAREDREHATWEDPHEVETRFYTVETNMGYEMAHSISFAMEQMNQFYRQVFQHETRGGSMRRCGIRVYATREEFDEHEGARNPGVRGFFVPLENRVATYDPRTDGRPLSKLWTTLFHEASHQFTEAVTTNLMPGWLNEGTASYFEGARLLPSGQVQTNLIPESRLRNLVALFDVGEPKLADVVSYFEPGSYDGSYYPFGWGLVYFFRNYENEESERVYLPIYLDYMQTYTKGGKHDVLGRFVEYFVEEAEQPGIETFEDFEAHWTQWIRDLHAVHFGGPEEADALLEQARRQVANEAFESARETYGRALDKRPSDVVALLERSRVLLELDQEDGALYDLRRVIQTARDADFELPSDAGFESAEELIAHALEGIREIDRSVAKELGETVDDFVAATREVAETLSEAGFPRGAAHVVDTCASVLGGEPRLAALRAEIETAAEIDLRRWRRLPVDGLELWDAGDDWSAEDGDIRLATDGLVTCTSREALPETYRYEITVHPLGGGEFPVYGLLFGSNAVTGAKMFAYIPAGRSFGLVTLKEGPEIEKSFPAPPDFDADELVLAVDVGPGRATFFVDGHEVGTSEIPPHELAGRVGVFGQDTEARFTRLRLLY